MGYHVELVASPPRPIPWIDLSQAAKALGWQVSDAEQDIVLMRDGRLVTRLNFSEGEAWVKTPDDEVMTALIELAAQMGLRVRGDEFESYRSLDDWYVHPDDKAARAQATAPYQPPKGAKTRRLIWNVVRLVVLALCLAGFAGKVLMEQG